MHKYFLEIFEYHHHFNIKLIEQVIENIEQVPIESSELFSHVLNAYQIWNSRIIGFKRFGVFDIHPTNEWLKIEKKNFSDTNKILKDYDLPTVISYKTSKGASYSNSIQDILFHVANHTSHHRGQIIAQLKANGIKPIITDYIFYKRKEL